MFFFFEFGIYGIHPDSNEVEYRHLLTRPWAEACFQGGPALLRPEEKKKIAIAEIRKKCQREFGLNPARCRSVSDTVSIIQIIFYNNFRVLREHA